MLISFIFLFYRTNVTNELYQVFFYIFFSHVVILFYRLPLKPNYSNFSLVIDSIDPSLCVRQSHSRMFSKCVIDYLNLRISKI